MALIRKPLAASATPKVACAAVVVAGSLPMVSGKAQIDPPHPQHASAAPAVTAIASAPTPPKAATHAIATHAARIADTAAVSTALKADCADGAIDGSYPHLAVVGALRASEDGQEYGGCKQALTQATLARHAAP